MHRLHRVFCATPWELEAERHGFYDAVGQFNDAEGLRAETLYVPVSLANIHDKRPYQYTIDENIRACRHYILALSEDWGPPECNFERDYRLAAECRDNPSLPMREIRVLLRNRPDGKPSSLTTSLTAAGVPSRAFTSIEEFQKIVRSLLAEWLPGDAAAG